MLPHIQCETRELKGSGRHKAQGGTTHPLTFGVHLDADYLKFICFNRTGAPSIHPRGRYLIQLTECALRSFAQFPSILFP